MCSHNESGAMIEAIRQTLILNSGSVSYLEWNPLVTSHGDILLLHGGGYDSASLSWGGVGGSLAEAGWHVLAPDTPGYGESADPSWRCTQDRLVQHVDDVVEALALDQFVLAGLSMGGGMALGYTLNHPERVRGLVLLGSYGLIDRVTEGFWSLPVHVLTWAMLKTGLVAHLMRRYARTASPASIEKGIRSIVRNAESRTPQLIDELVRETRRHPNGKAVFSQWQDEQYLLTRTRTNYLPLLHTITKPTVVINGERDIGISAAAAARAAAALTDSRLVIVPGAGHWVQRDDPEVVLRSMLDFLGEISD